LDNSKIGKFIYELRKEKGLSQYDLADMIPISREAISKWERGKNLPDTSCLFRLSEIFNISINEILYGERKNESNNKEIDNVTLDLYNHKKKMEKIINILLVSISALLIGFLFYYFISNYNTIKAYTINYDDGTIVIRNGILVVTKDKTYFRLGDIITNEDITDLQLYWKDDNGQETYYYQDDKDEINLFDLYGYNEFFNYNKLDKMLNNLYLKIIYADKETTIKLTFNKDFANDKIVNTKTDFNGTKNDNDNDNTDKDNIEKLIKEKFTQLDENTYAYTNPKENYEFTYSKDLNIIRLTVNNNSYNIIWEYVIEGSFIYYQKFINDEITNAFTYVDNKIVCETENCNEDYSEIEYFENLLNEILGANLVIGS